MIVMKIIYYGYVSFLIEIQGNFFVIDFFISFNELVKVIDVDSIFVDYILVMYGYVDYVVDVESIVKCIGVIVIFNYEVVSWFG